MTLSAPIIAFTLLLPAPAQTPVADPTASTIALKRGEKVVLTLGTTHGTLSGRVLRLADDGLVLVNGPTTRTVPYGDLERIVRPRDSVWNGALIGYAVGFGVGAAMVLSDKCHQQPGAFDVCFDTPRIAAAVGGLLTGPIGMAVGAIGDALVKRPRVVFDRRAGPHTGIEVTPTIVRGGGGFRAAIAF